MKRKRYSYVVASDEPLDTITTFDEKCEPLQSSSGSASEEAAREKSSIRRSKRRHTERRSKDVKQHCSSSKLAKVGTTLARAWSSGMTSSRHKSYMFSTI